MKKIYFFILIAISFTANSQNFRITSASLLNTSIDSCSSTQVDILTWLGCRNFSYNSTSVVVSNNTIDVTIDYNGSMICAGALSQPTFNEVISALSPGTYTVSVNASINGTVTNTITTSNNLIVTSCNTVAIESNLFSSNFTVYPNPANDFINFNFSNEIAESLNYEILDIKGQIIKKSNLNASKTRVSLVGISSGIYFLRLTDNKTTITKKLVIQ